MDRYLNDLKSVIWAVFNLLYSEIKRWDISLYIDRGLEKINIDLSSWGFLCYKNKSQIATLMNPN
jgi:hypothetical protein